MDKLTLNPHHKVAVGSTSTTDMEGKEDMKSEVVVKEEVCTDPEDTNMEGEHASEPLTGEEEDNESKTRSKMETQDELTLEIKRSKYSSPLNSLPNPNNSLEHHCLICYKMLVDIEATGGTSHTSTGADVLHGNLNVMVIMKNLLRVPSKDLETCLRHCGNPTNWLRICAECQPLIQNALSLNGKLMEVSKQLDKSRELIVERMRDSLGRNNEAFGSSSKCLTCDTDGCRGHENYLTDKIRKFVSKKHYPVITNPYEEGDREAKDKVQLATLAIQNRLVEEVGKPAASCVEHMSCSWSDSDDDNAIPEITNATDECNGVSEAPTKNVKKTSAAQTQIKLSSVSTRPVKPKRVLFMSPSTSTKIQKAEKVRAKVASAPKARKWLKLLSCGTCPHLQPKTLYDYLTHIALHQKRPNRCVECLVYLPKNEATIAEHWSQFHNESDKFPYCTEVSFNLENIWKCSKCPEKFSSIEEQFRHERRAHQMCIKYEEGEYKCVTCSSNLHSFEEWQLHRAVEHPQIAEMSCFYCDKTFISKTKEGIDLCNFVERLYHVIDKHPRKQVRPTDPCQLCGMDFETPKLLDEHLINFHSIPEDNLYPCPIPLCTFARKSSYQLRKHIEAVHGSQKYVCDNCGWSGKPVQQLQNHQFKRHGIVPDGFTLLTCEFEGCSFQAIRTHHMLKHAYVHRPENERPFKCEICEKGFYDRKHFMEHQNIHANKESKPYQCEICGNSFAVKNYLYIHNRLSHQGRFFPSTHKKKPKRTTSKDLSKTKNYSETHAAATGSDIVSPERKHGLSYELVATTTVAPTKPHIPLPDTEVKY
ncbi:unnamed protein product [Orchesella dallaii]|uniref:C2H2-type domain-containing protein n=1 Tax=Orchesella dallaii TaxID=48710 RepID=A0ABP1Q1A2_9HEXA